MEKHSASRLSYLFAHLHLLSSGSFSSTLLSSNLSLLSASALLCFSSVHIVGSLTSKLPSMISFLCFNKKPSHSIPLASPTVFRCFSRFRCLLDSRADDTEEDYLVAACTSAWHKHAFFELSHCVVKSGAWLRNAWGNHWYPEGSAGISWACGLREAQCTRNVCDETCSYDLICS